MLGTNGCYEFKKGEYHTEIECQKNSSVGNPARN